MEKVVHDYLTHLGIPVSKNYCKKLIYSHPDFPSLLSIADAFEQLGINYQVGRVEKQKLSSIQVPFIYFPENRLNGLKIAKDKNDISPKHLVDESTQTIVIKADYKNEIQDVVHNRQYSKELSSKKILLILILAFTGLVFLPQFQAFSSINLLLTITAIIGTVIGILLIGKEVGIRYKPVESFCNVDTRTNCDRILNSNAAKLFGFYSLSEATLTYFLVQLILFGIITPFSQSAGSIMWGMAMVSILTVPVIGYSLYYQAIKAKTWCRLCFLVDIILAVQLAVFTVSVYGNRLSFQTIEWTTLILSIPELA